MDRQAWNRGPARTRSTPSPSRKTGRSRFTPSTDPLAGSAWSEPGTIAGFLQSPPNRNLIEYAAALRPASGPLRILDLGCGAGRNAVPLAAAGARVLGLDLSWPMLRAAATRDGGDTLGLVLAPMTPLPVRDRAIDLIVAHGVWNLARSDDEFREAVREAARVARQGARLFLFTFSRHTLAPDAAPVEGQSFTFTQFSGAPQIFLREDQLVSEMRAAGFDPDPDLPLRELNLPPPGQHRLSGPPVIFEGGFRRRTQGDN